MISFTKDVSRISILDLPFNFVARMIDAIAPGPGVERGVVCLGGRDWEGCGGPPLCAAVDGVERPT